MILPYSATLALTNPFKNVFQEHIITVTEKPVASYSQNSYVRILFEVCSTWWYNAFMLQAVQSQKSTASFVSIMLQKFGDTPYYTANLSTIFNAFILTISIAIKLCLRRRIFSRSGVLFVALEKKLKVPV